MKEEPESLKTPEVDRAAAPESRESPKQERIDRVADEMAEKGTKTEKEYEREHESIPATGPGGIS